HPLVLAFLGTADVGQHTAIVSLYMRNGNLMEYLKSHRGCDKKQLILQVAEAVNFLHTSQNLVHGDIKCANVLISDFGEALLADFGLSTFVEQNQSVLATMTAIRNMHTLRFAAPELLTGPADRSGKPRSKTRESDIYAFGMLILEAS
ncbi:kinase-like protein, partial [Auricularia subglabra TFB-10046 SS5]